MKRLKRQNSYLTLIFTMILLLVYSAVCYAEPPVSDPNGPYTGTVGVAVAFDGTGSFDTDGTLVAYDWDFGDGSTGTGQTPTHAYAAAGTYTVTLTVTDNEGATDTASTTADIVGNQPPVSDPNGPYTGTVGVAVAFDGTGSFDTDGTLVAYDWDFGDGSTGTGQTPTHAYAAAGTYTVTLTVTDNEGATDTASTTADIVGNQPPVSDPNGPYTGTVGVAVAFDGTGSFDTDGTLVAYDWDFGDGSTGTGQTPTHAYAAAGTYTVTLTVTDNEGATDTASTTAEIQGDADLSINKSANLDQVVAGNTFIYTISVNNGGPGDAHNVVVTDTLPPGVTYVLDTDSCVEGPVGMLTCSLGTIAAGGSFHFDITVRVDSSTTGTITNVASVTSDTPDPDPGNDDISETTEVWPPCDPAPLTQGYWHRQCLGVPASDGGLDPGRNGRGPKKVKEPDFVDVLMPAADTVLADKLFIFNSCSEGMDADPPSSKCERAIKQYTALVFNQLSGRVSNSCEVDLSPWGCVSTNVGDLMEEITSLINSGDPNNCKLAADCAALVNEGEGLEIPGIELNEVRIDQPSTDIDEYFELIGPASMTLNGLTYLVIGDGAGGTSGVIEEVIALTGNSVPSSGFFVAAEDTYTLGSADITAILNFENSDNVTHMIVRDFIGSNGDDLDTDDDGVLDVTPWSEIVDCVALIETVGSGEQVYCSTTVGPDGSFVPAHVYSCPSGWVIGPFDPSGGDDTPGAANICM